MPLLEIDSLTKSYPGVLACDTVSFNIEPGRVHALLGENGAGKSTLVKMIYGLVKPDSGSMKFEDAEFAPPEPRAARASGVAMVFQHFSLFEALTVVENIALGMDAPPKAQELAEEITELSAKYGLTLDPARRVGDLSAGERQRVEIIRCLLQNPKLLIMDEPTSVLTPNEVEGLFVTLKKLCKDGTAILYISHKLEEIRALCQSATILRRGQVVATCDPRKKSARQLAEMMVGTKFASPKKSKKKHGDVILSGEAINLKSLDPFGTDLRDLSFDLHAGEVLGVAGVAGNGQDELMSVLSGERLAESGTINLQGKDITKQGPKTRRTGGLLCAPEERLGHAAAPNMSLTDNTLVTGFQRMGLGNRGFLNAAATRDFADKIIEAFDVRTPSASSAAKSLSGGNLQKFVVGREMMQNPNVFVVNQPTWGVDAAAAASIRQAILSLAKEGAGVIVISQDLDELLEITDNLSVLHEGNLSDARPTAKITMKEIGLLMGGMAA